MGAYLPAGAVASLESVLWDNVEWDRQAFLLPHPSLICPQTHYSFRKKLTYWEIASAFLPGAAFNASETGCT